MGNCKIAPVPVKKKTLNGMGNSLSSDYNTTICPLQINYIWFFLCLKYFSMTGSQLSKQPHWNGKVVRMTALVFTGDVEDKLQRLHWIPRLSPWRQVRFSACMVQGFLHSVTWQICSITNLQIKGTKKGIPHTDGVSPSLTTWQNVQQPEDEGEVQENMTQTKSSRQMTPSNARWA